MQIAERDPYIVKVASQEGGIHKRKSGYANIRIHPILTVTVSRANEFFHGEDSPFSRAIDTLQRLLLVRPVQGNLVIPPICREYTSGVNEGKCMAPLPSQDDYKCGRFGRIPHQYIGTREVCDASNSSCKTEGPNGAGLPNADYLLFVSVSSIGKHRIQLSFNVFWFYQLCICDHYYAYSIYIYVCACINCCVFYCYSSYVCM